MQEAHRHSLFFKYVVFVIQQKKIPANVSCPAGSAHHTLAQVSQLGL